MILLGTSDSVTNLISDCPFTNLGSLNRIKSINQHLYWILMIRHVDCSHWYLGDLKTKSYFGLVHAFLLPLFKIRKNSPETQFNYWREDYPSVGFYISVRTFLAVWNTCIHRKFNHYSDFSSKITIEFIQVLFCPSFSANYVYSFLQRWKNI